MAVTSTGFQSPASSRDGNQPSVLDAVIIVGAEETPILSKIGKGSNVTNVLHSWHFDRFPSPRRNPRKEIDTAGTTPASTKQKLSNAVEIFERSFGVSWDQQKVKTFGAPDMSAEAKKAAVAHALDIEMAIVGLGRDSNGHVSILKNYKVRDESTPGEMAGIFHYLTLDKDLYVPAPDHGVRGNILAFDSARNGTGTKTDLTMGKLKTLLKHIWLNGTVAKDIYLGTALKDKLDTVINSQWKGEKSITDNVTEIDTAYGTVAFHLHRFFSEEYGLDDVLLAGNFDYAKIGELESRLETMAKVDTSDRKMYYTSCTLEVRNAFAFAAAFGLK